MSQHRTYEDIFVDYSARRRGIVQALTIDGDRLFQECEPSKDNLALYGQPDGSYLLTTPFEEVPPELPEPTLGINFARDGVNREDWFKLVAIHSDSWLIAVAFFNAARLDAEGRRQLFNSINMLPTCFEVVSGLAEKEGSAAQVINRRNSRRSEDGGYAGDAGDPCPHCGRMYKGGEFWIQCDDCDRWFDGKCVDMNQQKAAQSTKWTCPFCFKDSVQ